MENFQFQRRGPAAAVPGKVSAGGRAKPTTCYDDVFGGPPRTFPVPARPQDYREIFGAAAACSIPVLDLPPPPEDDYELRQCSALDYLDIFGGFGGDDFAATYHELFASQVSNGIGAPLPSELGNSAAVSGTSNSRESKGMGHEKQEMPVSGNITEGLSRDQFGCSLTGVAVHLNDGTNLLNTPTHIASWTSKSEAVNEAIHKNQAPMVSGFTYIVEDPETDKPNSEVYIKNSFDSNSSNETSEQQHLKKAELSGDLKYFVCTMKGDQRSTQLELSGSINASTYENNTADNQPAIPISNGFSAKTSDYQSPHVTFLKKKAEGKCQSKTVTNCTDTDSQSDLKVRFVASEDVHPNEEHLSCSYKGPSSSCNVILSPDRSMDDFTSDGGNTRVDEANRFKKSMPEFPSCIISQSSDGKTTEQKMSNSIVDSQKGVTVNECLHSRSSSCQSISSLDRSCLDSTFLTVSDINLRTQPSQGPPPARPPPGRPSSNFGNSGRNLRRTLTDYQRNDIETATTYKSHSFKQSVKDGSSPFDLEADVSSAAAASVAAIKEAMELAQAKLKSAKVSRERKKDNLQSRRKIGLNEDLRSTTRDEHQTVLDNQRIKEDMLVQLASGNTDGQDNVFAVQKKLTAFTPSLLAGDCKEKEINTRSAEASLQAKRQGEPEVPSVLNMIEDKVGEWKIAEQFYEFIQSGKFSKVPENSLKGDTEKRSNTGVGIIGQERNAYEPKRRENLFEPPKFVVWKGDSDRCQNPSSQGHSLEFDIPWNCSMRQTGAVNAHCEEKQPGEIQALVNTKQKTEWRKSEEGFICEFNKKNLIVNKDALKCKPIYGCQGPEKVQNCADETFGCEETEKAINVTDDYFKDHGEDNIVLGKLSSLDGNNTEANIMHVLDVSGKDVHLKTGCMNHDYCSFIETLEVEPKDATLLLGQNNGKTSKLPYQAYEWAQNENELKVPVDILDAKGKDGTTGAHEDFKGKVKENMQEPQFLDSNEVLKSAQGGWKGTGNVKKIDDAQIAHSVGEWRYISKVLPEFPGSEDAGLPVENDAHGLETRDIKGDNRENAKMSDLEKVRKMKMMEAEEKMLVAKEREMRKLKHEEERDKKLEEEQERVRIRLEEEREREGKKLEEEMKLKRLEEENAKKKLAEEREKRLEEERKKRELEEMERKRLEEERERKRLEDEERENRRLEKEMEKMLEEENERKRLEDKERVLKRLENEREKKKLEDEERKKRRLEEERKKMMLADAEREKRRLEEEWEKKRVEEEKEMKKLENEQREKKKLEEEERKKLEDEERGTEWLQEENEREKTMQTDGERKKSEETEERRLEAEREKLEDEREIRDREEKERIRMKQEEENMERSKLEEKERERRKQEEERERWRLEEIERERRKLEEKVRERKRIEEEERERKLEEEKVRERQKIEEEMARGKKLEEEKGKEWRKREEEKDRERKRMEEEREREREREKDRQAVERATREVHERAFADTRERAERAAVERITAEARQRALAEARERAEKASAEALEKSMAEKASKEARLRSERAAVERATAEARERAVEKAIAEKAAQDARERAEKFTTLCREGVKQNFSNIRDCDPQFQNTGSSKSSHQKHPDSNASFMNEKSGGSEGESVIRCKARMERHQRTIDRSAKALAEKNLRDIIAQREQTERHRLAETLDADVKRWSNGKEGNLRALLSTLQYILGPESGWHPIPLTDVVTAPAVKKAYRKATLCVHPDKLQQRGASIHQKYICEKVFDLLKEAWNKFNSEER